MPHSSGRCRRGSPSAERIADGKHAFFRAGFFLVATCSTKDDVVTLVFNRLDEGDGLQRVACAVGTLVEFAAVDPILNLSDAKGDAGAGGDRVAEREDLGKVVAGVDVEEFEGDRRGGECAAGEFQDDDGVFAAGEQNGAAVCLAGGLPDDVDAFRFE